MRKIAYILSLTMLLAACSGDAIFYTLEKEEKIVDLNNFNAATPVLNLQIYDEGATDYYIANGRQLWYSEAGESGTDNAWAEVSLDDYSFSGSETVPSVATLNNVLYFSVSDEDTDSANYLFYMNSMTGTVNEAFHFNRTDESGDDYNFHNIHVFSIEGKGMYVSKVTRSWEEDSSDSSSLEGTSLYYYPLASISNLYDGLDDGNLVTLPTMDTDAYVVKGVVYAEDTYYMILNQSSDIVDSYAAGVLLSSSDGITFTEDDPFDDIDYSTDSAVSYNNIYYSETYDMLFVSTRGSDSHPIFYRAYSGSWGNWQYHDEDDDEFQFSAFVELPSSVQSNTVLVGTRGDVPDGSSSYYGGDGYYELIISSQAISELQDNVFADDDNYDSSDLESSTITAFAYDTDHDKLYCATYDNGLWQNRWDSDDSEWTWYQE